jgi:hypothetical protein
LRIWFSVGIGLASILWLSRIQYQLRFERGTGTLTDIITDRKAAAVVAIGGVALSALCSLPVQFPVYQSLKSIEGQITEISRSRGHPQLIIRTQNETVRLNVDQEWTDRIARHPKDLQASIRVWDKTIVEFEPTGSPTVGFTYGDFMSQRNESERRHVRVYSLLAAI